MNYVRVTRPLTLRRSKHKKKNNYNYKDIVITGVKDGIVKA